MNRIMIKSWNSLCPAVDSSDIMKDKCGNMNEDESKGHEEPFSANADSCIFKILASQYENGNDIMDIQVEFI